MENTHRGFVVQEVRIFDVGSIGTNSDKSMRHDTNSFTLVILKWKTKQQVKTDQSKKHSGVGIQSD